MGYLTNLAVAIDQLFNALLAGWCDESFSSRAYRQRHKRRFAVSVRVVDGAFRLFGQRDHCRAAYESELARMQLPPAMRQ